MPARAQPRKKRGGGRTPAKTARAATKRPTARAAIDGPDLRADRTVQVIRRAALLMFRTHGYHGTSMREIAAAAGLSMPGVYHHFAAKLDILFDVMMATMARLLEQLATGLASAPPDPAAQLRAAVLVHVRFHTEHVDEAFVVNTELRALDEPRRRELIAQRDAVEQVFVRIVDRGVQAGVFATPHPRDATRALVSLGTAVSTWFRPSGPLTPDEIADRYGRFVLELLEHRPAEERRSRGARRS
jgi:AcrR family transcriptional regulator